MTRGTLLTTLLLIGCLDKVGGGNDTGQVDTPFHTATGTGVTGTGTGAATGTGTGATGTGTGGATSTPCPPGSAPRVHTTLGCVEGRVADGVEGFLGIPYAEPPVGPRRWARPAPKAPWTDIRPAVEVGEACIQTNGTLDLDLRAGDGAEDCLNLNVLRPEGTQSGDDLPVMLFVHGGGHVDGAGSQGLYVGASFARSPADPPLFPEAPNLVSTGDAVVVTFNYRLAQLGWLAHRGLSDEAADGGSGNQGLWDALMVLEWVQANARAFGGDPDRVLLFGESAGSVSACTLLAAPQARGTFAAVLLQSGQCGHISHSLDDPGNALGKSGFQQGDELAASLDCDGAGDDAAVLACMRGKSATEVMAVMKGQFGALDLDNEAYGPVIDGVLVPRNPRDAQIAGDLPDVPVVTGVTAEEGSLWTTFAPIDDPAVLEALLTTIAVLLGAPPAELIALYDPARYGGDVNAAYTAAYSDFVFICPTRSAADRMAPHTDVRAYWWNHANPLLEFMGVFHGVELSYVFGTGLLLGDEGRVSDQAISSWVSVAAGTPTVPGVGAWPLFGGSSPDGGTWVSFETSGPTTLVGPHKEACDWFNRYGI